MADYGENGPSAVLDRWLSPEAARREVDRFDRRFGKRHLNLACHAALPLILTPELVNLIRFNFQAPGRIPWIAEADLLLSPLCRPMDEGLYEFEPRIREVLLERLEADFGAARAIALADFLMAWLGRRPDRDRRADVAWSYRWIVRAYRQPADAADEMAGLLEACRGGGDGVGLRRADQLQLVNLAEVIARPMLRADTEKRFPELLHQTRELAGELYGGRPVLKEKASVRKMPEKGVRPAPAEHDAVERPRLAVAVGKTGPRMTFVFIPPGAFLMGRPEDEPGRYKDESPRHRVTISEGFYMQTTPVTQGQWKAVMGDNPSYFKDCGEECPVEIVSWEDAHTFIRKLNDAEGEDVYRLPSEAQWEYACRAGSETAYCFGSDPEELDQYAWYEKNSKSQTHAVGLLKPNSWGLYDMHGNVLEWCEDDWHGSYEGAPVDGSAWIDEPKRGGDRVVRGGSWGDVAGDCRSALRYRLAPVIRGHDLGFRLTRSYP